MSYFALKISDPASVDLVNSIKAGSENFVIQQLNQLESDLKVGEKVFIQLGGDKVSWDKGLIGLAQIIKEPYDKGYDSSNARNFRLGLKMILTLENVIKREEFRFYVDAYDAGGIGPNTKGEQNQAIKSLTDKQAYSIIRAMVEKQNELEPKIRELFNTQECDAIFGKMSCMIQRVMTYAERIALLDSENMGENNKNSFKRWMEKQVKPEGDSDAGNPYSEDTINAYVSNIDNTAMPDYPNRSIFYTTNEGIIQSVIFSLDNSESKNSTQKSAVRKYYEYIKSIVVDNIVEDVYNHNLYGIHIKLLNDALSDTNPHICIGWSAMGDVSDISSRKDLEKRFDEVYPQVKDKPGSRGQQVGQVWLFLNEVKIGDYVIFADDDVFHIGRVESDYYYDDTDRPEQDSDYKSNRKVKWIKKNIYRSVISNEFHNSLKAPRSFFSINDYKSAVVDLIKDVYVKDENGDVEEEYMELVFNTSLDSDFDRNRIIFGAPGTGKSYTLNEQAKGLIDSTDGKVERVTFHPDYTYSQFVGAYKPTMDGNDIRYEFVPGPFMRVYVEALKSGRTDNPQPFLLIVEEINRAKVAGVFGDIFQLLDRDDDGVSVYEIQASEDIKKYLAEKLGGQPSDYTNIRIPNNMFIWATMNSADQGVFPMDTAFKRRWSFEYLGIDAGEDKLPTGGKFTIAGTEIEWNKLRKGINAKMTSPDFHINEDKLMGPFFLSGKLLKSDEDGNIINPQKFIDVFKSKVLMYLYEDAIKQRKHDFFHNCDTSKYSSVCDAFDEHGVEIFGSNFMSDYYNK